MNRHSLTLNKLWRGLVVMLMATSLILLATSISLSGISTKNKIDPHFLSKLPSLENAVFWVEFIDRPSYGETKEAQQLYLSTHSELPPVSDEYIRAMEAMGFSHRATSELTNEASFEGMPSAVYALIDLPFIKRISEVKEGFPTGIQMSPSTQAPPNPKVAGMVIPTIDDHVCTADHANMFGSRHNSVPMAAINIQDLHNADRNGSGVKIGIIDSGVQQSSDGSNLHEVFNVNVSGGGAKIFKKKDIARGDAIPEDEIGHGTAVAGLCAGFTAGANYYYIGGAPDAQLAIAKFSYLDSQGEHWPDDKYAQAVKWCVDSAGVDIINVSVGWWGSDYPNTGYNRPARWADWAAKRGVIVCISAGNDWDNEPPAYRSIYAPADNFNCISVGATRPDGGLIAIYCRRGPAGDSRLKPDVAAPGGVKGTGANYWNQDSLMSCPSYGGAFNYAWFNGTSFASPLTAGAIACMLEATNSLDGDPLDTRMRIWETATDKGTAGPDSIWGYGLLHINSANNAAGYANFLIRDTRQGVDGGSKTDNGYLVSCDTGNEPETSGNSNGVGIYQGVGSGDDAFWKSPEFFVDNDNNGVADNPNQPIAGQNNIFKVMVTNIGDANGTARTHLYYTDPNTGMTDWTEIGSVDQYIPSNGDYLVRIDWDTPSMDDLGQSHWCIGATVEDITGGRRDDQRPLPGQLAWGARPKWDVVKCDNFAMRNFWVRDGGSTDSLYFYCENTTSLSAEITLNDVSTLLQGWSVSYDDTTFTLVAGEIKTCTLFVDIPQNAANGDSGFVTIEAITDSGEVLGGISQIVKKVAAHHFDDCTLTGWTVGEYGSGMFEADPGMYISQPCGLLAASTGTNGAAWGITPGFGLVLTQNYTITTHFVALTTDNYNFQVLNNAQIKIELDYPTQLVALRPSGPPIPLGTLNPGMWYTLTVRCYPARSFFDVYLGILGMGQTKVGTGTTLTSLANDRLLLGDIDSLGVGRGVCAWDDIKVSGTFTPPVELCCDVNMIPDTYPIYVPRGGHFGLTGIIGNPTAAHIVTDVWVGVKYLNTFYQLWLFLNIPLNPGQYVSAHLNQGVPTYAPVGTYNYIAYCGDKPTKCDSALFQFTVTNASVSGGYEEWVTEGGWEIGSEMKLEADLPLDYFLSDASPNPFNSRTIFKWGLPKDSRVSLAIYNLLGQRVETVIDGLTQAGYHSTTWDASGYSSGIYFIKLNIGERVLTKRMTLLK